MGGALLGPLQRLPVLRVPQGAMLLSLHSEPSLPARLTMLGDAGAGTKGLEVTHLPSSPSR